MRKFVVSDLHGNGPAYDTILSYLENISQTEEIEWIIAGDLIDKGEDSLRMLEDVEKRMSKNDSFRIHYLGGDHELLMYQALLSRKKGERISPLHDWIKNGGDVLEERMNQKENREETYERLKNFLGNLKIYYPLPESIYHRPILLVHAAAPKDIIDTNLKISDNNQKVYEAVWNNMDRFDRIFFSRELRGSIKHHRFGHPFYFIIKGHIPIENEDGFFYHKTEHYLNIDGEEGTYLGRHIRNHIPLVEIKEDSLSILIFNSNNQISSGYILKGSELEKMKEEEIEKNRMFLKKDREEEENFRIKVLIK